MTLTEFAMVVDATPKWVLNTHALLGQGLDYTLEAAERLALIRILNRDFDIPLPRARELTDSSLHPAAGTHERIGIAGLTVDLPRLRAAIATRRAQVATQHEPRRAGRKPKRAAPLAAARRYGIDLTLLQANLWRQPVERLRQLDGMVAFSQAVRRMN